MRKAAVLILSLIAAGAFAAGAFATKPAGAECWTSSSEVSLGQSYSVSASGLPNGGQLNLITIFPDGAKLTSPITASDGAFSLQTSGANTFAAQTGTYTFMFVGRVNWPSGTWNKLYASCSMQST